MVDRKLLILYSATTTLCMIYGLIVPFLPILAEDKHLSVWQTGLIFAAHPFAGLIISPFVGTFMYKVGRRNVLCFAFVCTAIGLLASGMSTYMDETWFLAANIVSRGLTGIAGVSLFTDVIAIIASEYPEKVFEYVGLIESFAGLGFLLGPLAGAGLYIALGYAGTFFTSAGFYLVSAAAVYVVLGPDREYRLTHKDENILRLAIRPKIFVTTLPLSFGMAAMGAQNMFISTHLRSNGLSTKWVAAAFAITGVGFLTSCVVLVKTIEGWNKKLVNGLGCAVSVLSIALVGPWPSFIPESLPVILSGFGLMQLGLGLLFVQIVPSLIEVATKDLGMDDDDKLIDKLSGICNAAIESSSVVFGEFVGPLVQGGLIPLLGIRDSCGCFAAFGMCVFAAYVITFLKCGRSGRGADGRGATHIDNLL